MDIRSKLKQRKWIIGLIIVVSSVMLHHRASFSANFENEDVVNISDLPKGMLKKLTTANAVGEIIIVFCSGYTNPNSVDNTGNDGMTLRVTNCAFTDSEGNVTLVPVTDLSPLKEDIFISRIQDPDSTPEELLAEVINNGFHPDGDAKIDDLESVFSARFSDANPICQVEGVYVSGPISLVAVVKVTTGPLAGADAITTVIPVTCK